MPEIRRVPIENDLDIVAARIEGRNLARAMGFGVIDQARIATVISELARNIILYARGGQIILSTTDDGERIGLEIVCEDNGPGIEDVKAAMKDDHPAVREGGMGLPGARRLMDDFEIQSEKGRGTRITTRKYLP